jgi:glycosyltransferase involved in cell wall biosynthesis
MKVILLSTSAKSLIDFPSGDGYHIRCSQLLRVLMASKLIQKIYSIEIRESSNISYRTSVAVIGKYTGIPLWSSPIRLRKLKCTLMDHIADFFPTILLFLRMIRTRYSLRALLDGDLIIIENVYPLFPFVVFLCIISKLLGKPVILDMGDVLSFGRPLKFVRLITYLVIESIYARLCDIIVFVTDDEKVYFSRIFHRKINLLTIPIYLPLLMEANATVHHIPMELETLIDGKKIVLFSGDLNSPFNISAVNYIINSLAPFFLERDDVTFVICGRGRERFMDKALPSNVYFTGFLPKEHYQLLLEKAMVCIAPMVYNTGLKTKILEYAFQRKVVVISPQATLGLPIKEMPSVIVSKLDTFPQVLRDVLDRINFFKNLTEKTHQVVIEKFSFDAFKYKWENLLLNVVKCKIKPENI